MGFGAPHLPQHDPFNRSNIERNMQQSPGHRDHGLGGHLHALNLLEVAIIAGVLVGIALAVLFFVML